MICVLSVNSKNQLLERKLSIYGDGGPGARYGAALANVGDLDEDGFADFAVGSPFENEGKGAIRLYYGREDIENINSAIQKDLIIRATDLADSNLRGFGISFTKTPLDVDGNQLMDLGIGKNKFSFIFIKDRLIVLLDLGEHYFLIHLLYYLLFSENIIN